MDGDDDIQLIRQIGNGSHSQAEVSQSFVKGFNQELLTTVRNTHTVIHTGRLQNVIRHTELVLSYLVSSSSFGKLIVSLI